MTSYYQQSDNKLPNSSSEPDLIERNDHWLPHLLKTHNHDNTLKLCLSPSPTTSRRTLPPSFLGVDTSLGLQLCGKPSTAHAQLHQVFSAVNLEHCLTRDVGNSSTFSSTHSHKPTVFWLTLSIPDLSSSWAVFTCFQVLIAAHTIGLSRGGLWRHPATNFMCTNSRKTIACSDSPTPYRSTAKATWTKTVKTHAFR